MNTKILTERDAERALVKAFNDAGLMALHMNTTIDGFPDILVAGRKIALVEMKYESGNPRITSIMETSQPAFMERLHASGFHNAYLCVYDGECYWLYDTSGILFKCIHGDRIGTLGMLYSGTAGSIAGQFLEVYCGV